MSDMRHIEVLTYGGESLISTKNSINKIRVLQMKIERAVLDITLRDKVPNTPIRMDRYVERCGRKNR